MNDAKTAIRANNSSIHHRKRDYIHIDRKVP